MPDSKRGDVLHIEVSMVDPGVTPRHYEMIDVAEEGNESRTAPRGRLGELPNHRRSGVSCRISGSSDAAQASCVP